MAKPSSIQAKTEVGKIIQYAKAQLGDAPQSDLILKFIQLYYSQAWAEDLQARPLNSLYGAAMGQWKLAQDRKVGELKIQVFNPTDEEDGWRSRYTIIQIITDDMPFVIDSMRMELNRMGFTIHFMVSAGGMNSLRDKNNKLKDVMRYDSAEANVIHEAPIMMQIDKQTDPTVIANIIQNIRVVLSDVRSSVEDWSTMREHLREMITALHSKNLPQDPAAIAESIAFLEWMLANHFTFLGCRDYELEQKRGEIVLRLVKGSGLGILRDETRSKMSRNITDLPEKVRRLVLSKEDFLIISKTNTRATVHRPTHTDYIGVKLFNEKGELIGERRFIGLYTSLAYESNPKAIPFLRDKVATVMKRSGLSPKSHAGKDLLHIMATLPRDDLFQATNDELFDISMGILHLQDRRRTRLFLREDAYGRFISCLIYIPRENFNTALIERMQEILMKAFEGVLASFTTQFSDSILARLHIIIRVDPKKELNYSHRELQEKIIAAGKTWQDAFKEATMGFYGEEQGNAIYSVYKDAFSAAYQEAFLPSMAIPDIQHMEKLTPENDLEMAFYRLDEADTSIIKFKIYCLGKIFPLSDALPMLENMGLRVVQEVPYRISRNHTTIWINEFSMTYTMSNSFEVEEVRNIFQEAFYQVWRNEVENDALNKLVLAAQLSAREISLLRAYAKYLQQTNFTFSYAYMAESLVGNPKIAALLVKLFNLHFNPDLGVNERELVGKMEEDFFKSLESVKSLDQDRILRRFMDLVRATLRTNYYQFNEKSKTKNYISFKFDPLRLPELPLPLPKYEVFVYAPHFEAVHLRAAKVARGGIRWSDRREDFRTEILGLMKAQQVKNAVIVPAGAKGGFILKRSMVDATREELLQEGIRCYQDFMNGLLDITDNILEGKIISPARTICYDDEDPYLVVAADKGTATFSDIANEIAIKKGFWLKDAFASGGSSGYDHKKMGITARGAWVSAERHFQEIGINVDETEVTVVGIGDMSGDVFGNGLLMSSKLKMVAAFDHLQIFVDPNPNSFASYEERMRMYNLPRSRWTDYKAELISPGGGIFARTLKSIVITPEMKAVFAIEQDVMTPNELIQAILRSPVDLIWNGGIGTFVKSSSETNLQVSDRSNDAIRVNGNELRARVVCEGGNLGFTQLARIEYELSGGRVNTDFIDNSAGVDCSDHEVNIKILLNNIVASGDLSLKQRDELLIRMTDEVSELVLQNNYHQNAAISYACRHSEKFLNLYIRFIERQESQGKLNRELEFIPSNKVLLERQANHQRMTRPELAILLSYSKIILEEKIRKSSLHKDTYLERFVKDAFPTPLRKRYPELLLKHPLSREIISTQLSNFLVTNMGITFTDQMYDETGAPTSAIVRAFVASYEIFHMVNFTAEIESLDFKVDPKVQFELTDGITRLVRRGARWFLRNERKSMNIQETIDHFTASVDLLFKRLPRLLLGADKTRMEKSRDELVAANVPMELATKVASARPMYHALNIIEAATRHQADVYQVAVIYFTLVDRLELFWFREQIDKNPVDDRWSVLAKAAFKSDLDWAQRELTIGVLNLDVEAKNKGARVNVWFEKHKGLIDRWNTVLTDLRSATNKDFAILSVAVRELLDLAVTSSQTKK